jgi:hypothetical protein
MNSPSLRVLHLSPSLIAGSPVKLSRIQAKYGGAHFASSRCVHVHNGGSFDRDIDLAERSDARAMALLVDELRAADVLHFHSFGDELSLEFGIDLLPYADGKRVLIEYHSDPDFIHDAAYYQRPDRRRFQKSWARIRRRDVPILGATPRTARLYGGSYFPNAIDVEEPRFAAQLTPVDSSRKIVIMHAATNRVAKGTDYVIAAVEALQRRHPGRIDFVLAEGVPYDECLELKRRADISVGDVSGIYRTFHMSELESLALGNVVVVDMDPHSVEAIDGVVGHRGAQPMVVTQRDNLLTALEELVSRPERINELKHRSHEFMWTHWHPRRLVERMHRTYQDCPVYDLSERLVNAERLVPEVAKQSPRERILALIERSAAEADSSRGLALDRKCSSC